MDDKETLEYFDYQIELAKKEIEKHKEDEFKGNGTLEDIAKMQYCNLVKIKNLIEKLQKEIEKKDICLKACEDNLIKERQLRIKQSKVIDETTEYLAIIRDCPNGDKGANLDCENRCDTGIEAECWKQYFYRKVENE